MKLVVIYTSNDSRGEKEETYYDDHAYPQGSEGQYYRIWELDLTNHGMGKKFFKQTGYADSYAYNVEWSDQDMVEVQPEPKVVTQYEYVEVV